MARCEKYELVLWEWGVDGDKTCRDGDKACGDGEDVRYLLQGRDGGQDCLPASLSTITTPQICKSVLPCALKHFGHDNINIYISHQYVLLPNNLDRILQSVWQPRDDISTTLFPDWQLG